MSCALLGRALLFIHVSVRHRTGKGSNWSCCATDTARGSFRASTHADLSREDSKLRCDMMRDGEISWKRDRCRGLDYMDYHMLNFLGLNFKVENG